ncbi:MAG: 50S ribosomal protein L15 [Ktedonobacteraceae bacterium]
MKLSDLRPAPGSRVDEKRVGRGHGSGRGKTAGRGTKGQKARTGGKVHRAFNGGQTRLSKRLAFKRGLGNSNTAFRDNYAVVNIADLGMFAGNAEVKPEDLVTAGLMTPAKGRGLVKVLGDGELDRALTIHAHKVSAGARVKIEAAGGKIEIIPVRTYEQTKRKKVEKAPTQATDVSAPATPQQGS